MAAEYLNNSQFEKTIKKFRTLEKNKKKKYDEYKEVQKELSYAFYLLSKNILRAFHSYLVDEDDALQEGVLICFEKMHRFDFARGSTAFNFFSTIIWNHYRQLYRTAKSYNDLKLKFQKYLEIQGQDSKISSMRTRKKKGKFSKLDNKEDQ